MSDDCPCHNKSKRTQTRMSQTTPQPLPILGAPKPPPRTFVKTVSFTRTAPARSGACPFCLRKHLLKAEGYAEELAEEPGRAWEARQLLKNLLLAEDHAGALGRRGLKAAIRAERLKAEDGRAPDLAQALALADAMVAEAGGEGSRVAETRAEGATAGAAPAPAATTGDKK